MDIEPNNNTYECVNKSLVFGKNISNGTYYLVPMFATNADGSNNWKACANSSMYIKLNISDKEMLTTVFANRSDIECKMLKHEGQAEENIETKLTATICK